MYDWSQLTTPKFVHALVVDITNLAKWLLFAFILYTANPTYATILFGVAVLNLVAKYILGGILLKEQEAQLNQFRNNIVNIKSKLEEKDE